jgi:hypothetical protein
VSTTLRTICATDTVDEAIVLSSEVTSVTADGAEVTLRPRGAALVQERGAARWRNRSSLPCKLAPLSIAADRPEARSTIILSETDGEVVAVSYILAAHNEGAEVRVTATGWYHRDQFVLEGDGV